MNKKGDLFSVFKTSGSTMKSLISNIQSKINDYEAAVVENRLSRARLHYVTVSHEAHSDDVIEQLESEMDSLVSVVARHQTLDGINKMVCIAKSRQSTSKQSREPIRIEIKKQEYEIFLFLDSDWLTALPAL